MTQKAFVQREGGDFERKQFTIARTAEAFRILSDGLYSNKIKAIVRELSTNAEDSHIKAGNTDVFEVHLPSYDEPWFLVRDFGTGLSHEDVMELYSTYFGTNKAGDLDTTGSLGLGSKSPLSKQRSFTVISRFQGVENHYIVALNEDRIPEVNYLPEQTTETDKPNGMEIQVAVATGDIYDYIHEAANVYYHFKEDRRPRILNGKRYVLEQREILIEGKGWRVYKGSGSPKAIQANVAYPISTSQIKNLGVHAESVLSCWIEIDFDNGSLNYTPSREHLTYDKRTCGNLVLRIEDIVKEVNQTIEQRFTKCKTLWEARVLAWTMFWSNNADLRHLSKLADTGQIMWQKQKIAGQQLSFHKIEGVEGWAFTRKNVTRGWNNDVVGDRVSRVERKEFTPRENVMWCEIDMPRGNYIRCQEYAREHGCVIYLVNFETKAARKAFCEKMGLAGDEFTLTSDLPKPERAASTRTIHRQTSQVYQHNGRTSARRLYDFWDATEVDLDDGGVYVEMNRNKVVGTRGVTESPAVVGQLINRLANVGHEVTVIGVRPQVAKKFRTSDNWVDIFTYARRFVKIAIGKNNLAQQIINAETYQKTNRIGVWQSLCNHRDRFNNLNAEGSMSRLLDNVTYMRSSTKDCPLYESWRMLADICSVSIDAQPERDIDASVDELYGTFPVMQQLISLRCANRFQIRNFVPEDVDQLDHYISLVEGA